MGETNKAVTLSRKATDGKTVTSEIKAGGVIVHVKSMFTGTKNIGDILFEIAREKFEAVKQ